MSTTPKPKLWYTFRKCFRKKRYETLKAANKQAKADNKRFDVFMYPYECSECGGYHLTKNEHKDVPVL
jgi:predicted Zn-ribbon and HTH transcriptional regulator